MDTPRSSWQQQPGIAAASQFRCVLGAIAFLILLPVNGSSAEIEIKPNCQPRGAVVLLGEVAAIRSEDQFVVRTLERVELVPAPAPGTHRYLRAREIQDLLAARRVDLADHQFSGARLSVVSKARVPSGRSPVGRVTPAQTRRAKALVVGAIERHLGDVAPDTESWELDCILDRDLVMRLLDVGDNLTATGGESPWTGTQRFTLHLRTLDGAEALSVEAQVAVAEAAVVAVRSIPRGSIIQARDIEVRTDVSRDRLHAVGSPVRSVREVEGKETTRTIPVGQVLDGFSLRKPILVHRSDVVTVYARAPGITARTTARSREDGSHGDLVLVESMVDRQRYYARVTGIEEVDVYGGGARANGP